MTDGEPSRIGVTLLCVSGTGWGCGSWVWTGLCPGWLNLLSPLMQSLLSSVTAGLCSPHHYEAHAESLWSQWHREGLSLVLSPGLWDAWTKAQRLNLAPFSVPGAQDKSHPISSHPFALASNDAVLKLPWALPVLCYCCDFCFSFSPGSFLGFSGVWCDLPARLSGAHPQLG